MLKSMTFNGVRNNDIYMLRGRTKSPFHPLNRTISKNGKHYRLRKTERGLLEIAQPIGFVAKEDSTQLEIIESLTDWLITKDWGILTFDDEPGRKYESILTNSMEDFEKISWLREGTLTFLSKTTLGNPKSVNVTTTAQTHTITGQAETPWTVEVTFTANTNRFEFWAGDNYLQLNYDFIVGDRLTVSYEGRKVFLNGSDMRKIVSMSSHFEELKPGNVSVRASHAASLKYDERYY